jgi:hypothetical protein
MNRSIFQIWKQNLKLLKHHKRTYFFCNTNKQKIILFNTNTCCNYSFKKPNNLKEIYNAWDLFIDWSLNNGNSHIAFTINIPQNNPFNDLEYFKDILKMHPIYFNTENYENYTDLKNTLFRDPSTMLFCFRDDIHYFNKLLSWEYISTEENENGLLHLHGIIAYRNLMDYNKNIKNNILNNIKKSNNSCDVVFKDLNKFKDIKGWVKYLHKDKILVFPPKFKIAKRDIKLVEDIFSTVYLNNYNIKNNFKLSTNNNTSCEYLSIDYLNYFEEESDNFPNIKGIKLNKNELNENIFIDLILNYLILKDYYIYNDFIYSKIEYTLISYKKLGTIKEIIFEQFENNIISYLTENFPCQFIGFDFYFLIKTYKNQMENNILKIKNLSTNKITLNFSFLEFTDGIYDIEKNTFINKNNFRQLNICTIKYYNKSYNWIRKNKPTKWIEGLKNALGVNNIKDFTLICLFLASLFQQKNENNKKNYLYIYGKTNTGKSTYLTKVLTRFFGSENVGNIVNSTNFKFQDLQNKLLVIMDEFRYHPSSSSEFLKLLGGEPLLTTQKYSKNHITINKLMGLILSNYFFLEKNKDINKALLERLYIVEFLYSVNNNIVDINKALAEEEPNIIVFCNKLHFSYFNKKQKRTKIINKHNNHKKLINN